jgi:cell division protein FtsI (penicillin-binding protein 3)
VVINDPKGDAYGGGAAAAPVFSSVTSGTLRLLNVPPTENKGVAGAGTSATGGPA